MKTKYLLYFQKFSLNCDSSDCIIPLLGRFFESIHEQLISSLLFAMTGMANVLFGLTRPLRIKARLRPAASSSEGVDANALDSCVVASTVDDRQARIAVHVPAAGEL